jgi:hypothetical protein
MVCINGIIINHGYFSAEIMSHPERNLRLFEKAGRPGQKVMCNPRKSEGVIASAIRKILPVEYYFTDVAVTVSSPIGLTDETPRGLH